MLCKILYDAFPDWSFVGFYDASDKMPEHILLGPFTSETVVPCKVIEIGMGQCGLCAKTLKHHIAKDTRKLDNYIACDDETLSEIVLPCFRGKRFMTVLDIDSPKLASFSAVDKKWLEKIVKLVY